MKHPYTFRVLILVLSIALFSQCARRTVNISAMRPAEITFPSYVSTLLVVDRTKFDKDAVNLLEGILTGELPGEDRAGLQEVMSSLQSTLMQSPRFGIKMANETLKGNSVTSAFPAPLSWEEVERLCTLYTSEAVVAIEIFDTDFIVTKGKRMVKKEVKDDKGAVKEVEVEEYYAEGVGNVVIGFRLYDPKAKSIVDQQLFKHTKTWSATGNSIQDAVLHLVMKSEATRYLSGVAGSNYAFKIAPMPITLSRYFYSKSRQSEELRTGARQAEVSDFQGAIATWEYGLPTANKKQAGRISYNIAVAYEALGDLQNAKKWASRSYVEYGNKKAKQYAKVIDWRVIDEERVRKQMNQKESQ